MIQKADLNDLSILAEMSIKLWPHHTANEMLAEYGVGMANPDAAFFLAYADETPVGFAQCQLRHDYVEGRAAHLLAIWKESMCHRIIAMKELQSSC